MAVAALLGALILASAFVVLRTTSAPAKTNVLLVTLDTTRADHIGCYRGGTSQTPNIDQLAREGALFANCSTCTSMTLPSHASIMTANYPFAHGVRRNATDRLADGNLVLAEVLGTAGYATRAVVAAVVLNRVFGLSQGFDQYDDLTEPAGGDPSRVQRRGDEVSGRAIELLRSVASDPFFLWVHFYDPHYPYESPREDHVPPAVAYGDEIAFVDAQVGRLLQELRLLGLDENTLIVLAGDHGEGLDEHDEWQHGYFVYESTLRVPLVMRGPGIAPGGVVEAPVRTVDIAPTILELLGQPPLPRAQGVSLTALIAGEARDASLTAAYAETLEAESQLGLSALRSLTMAGWKYVLGPAPALYNLDDDPEESVNRIAEHPDRAADLHEQLRALIAGAPPPPKDDESPMSLSTADVARLESLGYVASASKDAARTELDRFDPRGGNPADYAAAIREYELSRFARRDRRFGDAEKLLRSVTGALPEAAAPLGDLAAVLREQGRSAEAIPLCERSLELEPASMPVRLLHGQLLMDINRPRDAVAQLTMALAEAPDSVVVLYNLGIALTSAGRYAEARQHFETALKIEPRNIRVLHGMAVFYVRQNMLAEAAATFRRALKIDPNQPRLKQDLQHVLRKMGQ